LAGKSTSKGQILRSASVIALATAISRICGYFRDQRIALLLGTSPVADAFFLVFRLPSMIRRMVAEGSLSASFIPVFTEYLGQKPRREVWDFAEKVFWDMALALGVIAALGFTFSRQLVEALTLLGAGQTDWTLAVLLNRIIFPCVFFLGLAAMAAAILNSFQRFGVPASTSIVFNLAVIAASFGVVSQPIVRSLPQELRTPAVALAMAILVGAALQVVMQIPSLVRLGMRFVPKISVTDAGVRKVGRLMGPSFFGMGVYQINMFVDTMFATSARMPSGSVTSLYVADRVMQLVLGSYAIAMSTALLPAMSHQVAAGQYEEMKRTFGFSLRVVSFIAIPAAAGLVLLRRPIIQVLFQHGQFNAESTALTARALLYYSLGLPAFAAIKLITPMYYSAQDTLTPARVGLWVLGLNLALNAAFLTLLFRYLSNGSPALASSISAYFQFTMLAMIFRRRLGPLGGRRILAALGKMAACAAAMIAVAVAATRISTLSGGPPGRFFSQAWQLAAIILCSVGVYLGLAWLLRCEELGELGLLVRGAEQDGVQAAGLDV
jgi:putative peptidoglycan lipid II flippase